MQSFWARIPIAGRLVLDTGMLLTMILLIDPRASGIALHEWVGIVIAPVLVFHLTLNWPWIVQVTRTQVRRLPLETRINSVLNSLLFVVMVIAIVSGVLISQEALPWMGFNVTGSEAWRSRSLFEPRPDHHWRAFGNALAMGRPDRQARCWHASAASEPA